MQAFNNYFEKQNKKTDQDKQCEFIAKAMQNAMKTTPETAELVLVVDRSGSMNSGKEDFEGGINAYIKDQQSQEGEARITLVTFDNEVEVLYHGDIKDCPEFKLVPRGMTALNDAMGQTITAIGQILKNTEESVRPKFISVITTTDGGENASTEFETKQVQDMIKIYTEERGFNFVFLGADYDAVSQSNYGSRGSTVANFSKCNTQAAYSMASAKTSTARGLVADGASVEIVSMALDYTEVDRKELES